MNTDTPETRAPERVAPEAAQIAKAIAEAVAKKFEAMRSSDHIADMGLLTRDQVMDALQISRTTMDRYIYDEGLLPLPIKIGGSARWMRSDVMALIKKAQEDRDVHMAAKAAAKAAADS